MSVSELTKSHQGLILDGTKINWYHDRVRAWESGELVAPVTIDMALTTTCNMGCEFCEEAGAKILTPYGNVNIENIKKGDAIIGFDEEVVQGNFRRMKVGIVEQINKRPAIIWRVELDNGVVKYMTPDHPILVKYRGWKNIERLSPKDEVHFIMHSNDKKEINQDYCLGYAKGIIDGDGNFNYTRGNDYPNHMRLYQKREDILYRAYQVFTNLGLDVNTNKGNEGFIYIFGIETNTLLKETIKYKEPLNHESTDFHRGYLAGIYDAEGSFNENLRISNNEIAIHNQIKTSLNKLGIPSELEKFPDRKCMNTRITGDYTNQFKFIQETQPAALHKVIPVFNRKIKGTTRVMDATPIRVGEVFSLGTSTRTYISNGLCVHNCYRYLQHNTRYKITKEHMRSFLDDCAEIGVKGISLVSDGESSISPAYRFTIEYGHSRGISMASGTNAYLLRGDLLASVFPRLTYLRVNISAGEKERYNEIMGAKEGMFEQVCENIREMVRMKKGGESKCTVGMQMVFMPHYVDQLLPLAHLALDLEADYLVIKHCSDDELGTLGVKYGDYKRCYRALRDAEALSNDTTKIIVKWSKIKECNKRGAIRTYSRCYGPPFLLQISGTGLVAPCGMLFNSRYGKFHMGNITQQSFKEIWRSERYREVLRLLASSKFNAKTMCGSLCLQHSVNKYLDAWHKGRIELEEPKGKRPEHIDFV